MAYSTISKPSLHFNTKLYTGDGNASRAITGVGFQPDLVWIKKRNGVASNILSDSVRGVTKTIYSESTSAELTNNQYGWVSAFGTDGFTTANTNTNAINGNGDTYVSWNWKAGGTGSANSNGTISSTVSVNTTAGFSIVAYTGNGTGNSTIGHGLGATPKFIIVKRRDSTGNWGTYNPAFVSASDPSILYLDTNASKAADTNVFGTSAAFNNNTFTVGDWNGSNVNYGNYIAYVFAEKTGYSKFGNYKGNGNSNGTFIYTGFKPAWVLIKETTDVGAWRIYDSKRGQSGNSIGGNYKNALMADVNSAEESGATNNIIDFLSNGFKCRFTYNDTNGNGNSYIYIAFAEEPLVANVGASIPATAV